MHRFFPLPRPSRHALGGAIAAILVAALLSGCETTLDWGKKIDYKSAGAGPPLEIPPDLTTPNYDDRYQATTASGAAAARTAPRPSEVLPPNPDAQVARAGSERWLVVKGTPEATWSALRDFWAKNGFVLAVEQPALGIMETDWTETKQDRPQGMMQQFANKYLSFAFESYKRDKFRTRIERGIEPGTVEIYISHRGAEQRPMKIGQGGSPEDWTWVPSPPNPQVEAEFLEKLMVALGTPEPSATQAIAAESKAPDRARIDKGSGGVQLIVDDTFDRAWRRVGLALDRTGFTVVDRDRSKGLYFVRYANPELEKKKQEGWLADALTKMQFWKSTPVDKPEQYRVVVTQADPRSVVTVQDPNGAVDQTPNSEKILALLKDQLK
ncbi:MAG TPA: outer membrane protein assembly factor BamC [Casimicrobiaceae bacterium]|jgi:outer membrane protein assembly factor BamC